MRRFLLSCWLLVEGPRPPPNPSTGGATPAEASGVHVVRYRVDTGKQPPKAARAIVVFMPGFLAGAGTLTS